MSFWGGAANGGVDAMLKIRSHWAPSAAGTLLPAKSLFAVPINNFTDSPLWEKGFGGNDEQVMREMLV
jgi:hypothetical protein